MMIRPLQNFSSRLNGFSLIEVLVAILVLSLGIIGQVGFQATSLRNVYGSEGRSRATWLASEMVDRMRSNEVIARDGLYNLPMCSAGTSTDTVANSDQTAWQSKVGVALLNGCGSVVTNTNTGEVAVTIEWNDSRASGAVGSPDSANPGEKLRFVYNGYLVGGRVQ